MFRFFGKKVRTNNGKDEYTQENLHEERKKIRDEIVAELNPWREKYPLGTVTKILDVKIVVAEVYSNYPYSGCGAKVLYICNGELVEKSVPIEVLG